MVIPDDALVTQVGFGNFTKNSSGVIRIEEFDSLTLPPLRLQTTVTTPLRRGRLRGREREQDGGG